MSVDMPGVGFMHTPDCPVSPGAVTDEVPLSLHRLVNDEPPAPLIAQERDSAAGTRLLADLESTLKTLRNWKQREALLPSLLAAWDLEVEKDRAGDGIRPRETFGEPWYLVCIDPSHQIVNFQRESAMTGSAMNAPAQPFFMVPDGREL